MGAVMSPYLGKEIFSPHKHLEITEMSCTYFICIKFCALNLFESEDNLGLKYFTKPKTVIIMCCSLQAHSPSTTGSLRMAIHSFS